VIAYGAAVLYGMIGVLTRNPADRIFVAVIAFMTFTILYFTLMVNFFDLGENNRFRFTIDPLVFLLFARLLQDLVFRLIRKV
jgi:hypothetical protein